MLTLAFWNIDKKATAAEVVALAQHLSAPGGNNPGGDMVLCLAEPGLVTGPGLVASLGTHWWHIVSAGRRFAVLANVGPGQVGVTAEKGTAFFIGITRPAAPGLQELNLCFVHLGSPFGKWHKSSDAQNEASRLRERIEEFEADQSVSDTVILGDLNMDPYDPAMVHGRGLNAAMCRTIAARGTRTFGPNDDKETVRFLYNPMWSLLGDRTATNQPGSYYNSGDISDAAVWHCIDQVLIRHSLIAKISAGTPKIVTRTGHSELVSPRGVIKRHISDHLPIFVRLDL
jgi:hypothetical protein